ncbi:MAG: hypothetical protein J5865_00445 [Lachnospiraceae bacterium]|nr:hypothetical protein [Lachnospiraceae bacterium]
MNVKRSRKIPVMIVLLAIAVVVCVSIFTKKDPELEPVDDMADLTEVYASEEGMAPIIANGLPSSVKAIVHERHVYLKLGTVLEDINDGFFWDDTEKCLSYATASKVIHVKEYDTFDGAPVFYDNSKTDAKKSEDPSSRICVQLNYVAQFANMKVNIYSDPGRVFLRSKFGDLQYAKIKKGTALRVGPGENEKILVNVEEEQDAWLISAENGWNKVFLESAGHVGYVRDEDISKIETVAEEEPYTEEPYKRKTLGKKKVVIAWHQVFGETGIDDIEQLLEGTDSLNVVAPTWFSVSSSMGDIESRADSDYVRIVHEHGLQVWGLVENFNASTKLDYGQLFGRTSIRTKLVNNIVNEAVRFGLDGVNLDFEGLPSDAGDGYLQFIKELAISCHENDLFFSIDNYVPSAWTQHYHRAEQAKIVDYFVLMAYDEHYAGSDAGSTASLPFIKKGIEDTIAAGVPAKMILVGMPFYSRIWRGEDAAVSSETMNMAAMHDAKKQYRDFMVWDEESGQNYIEIEIEGVLNRIWVEDVSSIEAKLDLIFDHRVAGIACWKLGMEIPEAWEAITAMIEEQ